MSSLFSTPNSPDPAPAPAAIAPPEPLPLTAAAALPTPTVAPLASVASDPALAAQIDPATAAANALAMRSRGMQGTIATSLVGVPAAAASAAGADFSSNALLPQRKTLLGE